MRKRSIHLRGQKTSVSLEDEFWSAFQEIAALRNERVPGLINVIADQRPDGLNLSSAIRLFVLRQYRPHGAQAARGNEASLSDSKR